MNRYFYLPLFLIFCIQFSHAQNVGIGETNPSSKLEIKTNSSINYPQLTLMEDEDDYSRLTFSSTAQPNSFWTIAARPITTDLGKMNFFYQTKGDLMTLTSDGNLGIGITSPGARLDVKSTQPYGLARFDGGNNMFMAIYENGTYLGYWGSFSGAPNDVDFGTGSGSTAKLHLTTSAIPRLTINKDGDVGVGTTNPQEKLDVNGNLNLNGILKVNGNAGTAGQVLTSTGSGAPEWRSPPAPEINPRFFARIFEELDANAPTTRLHIVEGSTYNSTLSEVIVATLTNNIDINKSGIYHIDIIGSAKPGILYDNVDVVVYLYGTTPSASPIKLFNENTASWTNDYRFHYSFDTYLAADMDPIYFEGYAYGDDGETAYIDITVTGHWVRD